MIRSTHRLAAVGALVLVAGLGAATTTAQADTTMPDYVSGWVALSTGTTNTVTWSGAGTQTLTSDQSCAMTSSGSDLLRFIADPANPGVGLNSGAIGVRENRNANGTSCSAVDASSMESLSLALGTGVGSGVVAVSASLDIDLKQNAAITATAYLDGAWSGTFRLQSGNNINPADAGDPTVMQCNNPSDSGPDAKTGNNCRWGIGAAFDTLTLKADSGSFSLMGGADGVVPGLPSYLDGIVPAGASVLELAPRTQIVKCDQTTSSISGGGVKSSTWKNVGAADCVAYPYTASATTSGGRPAVHFVKPDWATGTAEWTTKFAYSGPVPSLQIAFDNDLSADGSLNFTTPGSCSTPVNPTPDANGNYACILQTVIDRQAKTVQFKVFVLGDIWARG